MYKINNPMIKQIIDEVNTHLSMIEVKGESVRHLFTARVGFQQIVESLIEVKDEPKSEIKAEMPAETKERKEE